MSGQGEPIYEPDYDSAAEAWLALEAVTLGMEFHSRARQLAMDFHVRLAEEKKDAALARVSDLETERQLVSDQIDLYGMSRGDEMGLDPESTLVCIANILETGHPAGADGWADG